MIDLPQEQAEALDRLSEDERRACAALIRAAIADYLRDKERSGQEARAARRAAMMSGFGIWKDRGIDGLEYQRRIRSEWDGRDKAWDEARATYEADQAGSDRSK